ncbi:hypothetical protein RCH09_003939, partial [Actimicrobium sp. GrIS 1.19]|nr:hypothetical protein [Actimicrobium sp. GrIS 1.19]
SRQLRKATIISNQIGVSDFNRRTVSDYIRC